MPYVSFLPLKCSFDWIFECDFIEFGQYSEIKSCCNNADSNAGQNIADFDLWDKTSTMTVRMMMWWYWNFLHPRRNVMYDLPKTARNTINKNIQLYYENEDSIK